MKTLFSICMFVFCIASTQAFAQIRKVPAEVTDALKAKFPEAKNVEWKDKLTNFQATFVSGSHEWTAEFTPKGEWKESNRKMTFEELPAAVKDGFGKSKYSEWKTGSVTYIEEDDKKVMYKIYAEKSAVQKLFLFFNSDGKLEKDSPGI